jgi:hypothetical protein
MQEAITIWVSAEINSGKESNRQGRSANNRLTPGTEWQGCDSSCRNMPNGIHIILLQECRYSNTVSSYTLSLQTCLYALQGKILTDLFRHAQK